MSIGIDLGTTFSCVAHYERGGRVRVLESDTGARTTPSVMALDEDGECLVGQHAKDVLTSPYSCLFDVKRMIGRRFDDILLQSDMPLWPFRVENEGDDPVLVAINGAQNHRFSPIKVSAKILEHLKNNAERKLGIAVMGAVITVPAYFNAAQRAATQKAAEIAGLKVLRILNEPTAAAIAYGLNGERLSRRNILIYDLGGGTFDVAIVNIDGPRITVKAKGGDTHLGGQDIDNIIMLKMIEKFRNDHGVDVKGNYRAIKRIKKSAEMAKITLSASRIARIQLDCLYDNIDFVMKITRDEFDLWIENILISTMIHVERVIREAGLKKSQINEIVLVGGSTRVPRIKEIIRESFGPSSRICESIHPDEAVAHGAAIMAAILSGVEDVQDMRMNDVIPMSIGIQCDKDYMSVMIPKGSTFPCSKKRVFMNCTDFQEVLNLSIYEGERAVCSKNRHLGELYIEIRKCLRGENCVEVYIEVDHNGILQATAIDLLTNKKASTTILYDHCTFTKEEIEKMTKFSEEETFADHSFRQRYRQLQKSEDLVYEYRSRLLSIKNKLPNEKFESLMNIVQTEIAWLESFPKVVCEEYRDRRRNLRKHVLPTLLRNFSF